MEEQSIFTTELSETSNNHILSAAKWSRFLGIVLLIASGLLALSIFGMMASWEEISDSFSTLSATNPMFENFEDIPKSIFIFIFAIGIGLLIFMGILFLRLGSNGTNYYSSNEETAFINTFKSAKTIFLVYAIFTVIGIVSSIVQLVAGL
jgi:hypothetical protein